MPNRSPTPAVVELLDRVHDLTGREPKTFTPSQVARAVDDHLAPRVKVGQPIDAAIVGHYATVLTERSQNRGRGPISFLYLAVLGYPVLPDYVTHEVGTFIAEQFRALTTNSRYVHPDQIERRDRYGHSTNTNFESFEGAVLEQEHRRGIKSNVKRESTYSDIRQEFVRTSKTEGAEKWEALAEAKGYQMDTHNLALHGGYSEDPDRIAKAIGAFVDPRFAHLITGEIYESKRKSLIKILEWVNRMGVTPPVITSVREHVAGGLIIGGDRLMKHVTPTDMVMSAIGPAIESVMTETPTESGMTLSELIGQVNPEFG